MQGVRVAAPFEHQSAAHVQLIEERLLGNPAEIIGQIHIQQQSGGRDQQKRGSGIPGGELHGQ